MAKRNLNGTLSWGVLTCVAFSALTAFAAAEKIKPQVEYFPLSAIRLTGGPLQAQQELNRKYLLQLEPDRLLCNYRVDAGLDPKAPTYRGWEANHDEGAWPLSGHILAFDMSGAAFTYEATGDEELKKRLLYIVDELEEVQKATGGVVLAALGSNRVMKEISNGDLRINGGSINGLNEPTYIMNKVLLGLYQIHIATGSRKALDIYLRFCDWFGVNVVDKLTDAQIQKLLVCEHGSLPENYCDAYLLTGDAKYIRWARRLCEEIVIKPLAEGNTKFLNGRHANCHIPKYTSCERVWRLTGEDLLHRAALNAWDDIVGHRLWAIGANCTNEHFFDPKEFEGKLLADLTGPESCNSVNMLRQTEAIFQDSPEARRMDFYERCLFNHLLSNHDPERGMVVYNTSMKPGAYRYYSDQFDSMWCCTGTGLEVPGKLGKMIYSRRADDKEVMVNLFAPSTLDWKSHGVKLRQVTNFPYEQGTTLVVEAAPADAEFTLKVRHPGWVADAAFAVAVNGTPVAGASKAGSYFAITRKWNRGDRVQVALPMTLKFEMLPHSTRYGAFVYGPIVLAGELGRQGLPKTKFWRIGSNWVLPEAASEPVPFASVEKPEDILKMVRPVEGAPLHFRTVGFTPGDVKLAPFFEIHFQRYTIYWELMTPANRKEYEAERARQTEQDKVTVDRVVPHNGASEKAHGLKGANTFSGTGMYGTRHFTAWRDARNGGWFSYRLKVDGSARTLRAWYYGKERGARTFDVLVDGQLLKTENLGNAGVDGLVAHDIPLPPELLKDKQQITVTLKAHKGNTAGGLFDLRVVR